MNNMHKLTDAQVNDFHQKGWVGPLDIFSAQEVEVVRKEMEEISQIELIEEQEIRTFYNQHFGLKTAYNHHFDYKTLCNLFTDERVVSTLNQLDEKDLLLWRTNITHRMPQQEGIGWHQAIDYFGYDFDETKVDLIFPIGEQPPNLTVWIALQDISPSIGLLSFANGSYKERFEVVEVPKGQGTLQEEKYQRNLEKELDENRSSEKCFVFNEHDWEIESTPAIKAGQMVVFTENLMHKAPANCSSQERWVVTGRYTRPNVKVHPQRLTDDYIHEFGLDLRKHFCILVSGNDNFGLNQLL